MIVTKPPTLNTPDGITPKKVAAYCRVSTTQEIQHHSLEAQQAYFEKIIKLKPNWIFAGIYADEASGRNNLKMNQFQAMLEDCRKGKIDIILVKSISRMGRNTLQFLQACDEFKRLNIDVFFEVEKLHITHPKAVLMLTIYASIYQNESVEKSYATSWGIRTRFMNGTSGFANKVCYGYKKSATGELVPYEPEAEIVKLIFNWHRQKTSLREISARLSDMNIKAPRGGDIWHIETIRKILNNEKYYGDVLLQKTYVSNYFTGKSSVNNGVLPKYLIKGHHEAIIKT